MVLAVLPFGGQVVSADPDPSPTWPTSWDYPADCRCDPVDQPWGERYLDLIGVGGCDAASEYAVYYHFDTTPDGYAYFRERVSGNPAGPVKFAQKAWVVLFDLPAEGDYEYLLSINGVDEQVQLWENTVSQPVEWSPILNDPAESIVWSGSTDTYARIVSTGSDYFVDWAIPLSELTSRGVDENATMYFTTSANANNFNKDYLDCYGYPEPVPNPPLAETCGLDIVLVMDESASIDGTEFGQMQTAFMGFVNALLPYTPTELALVDFGTLAHLRQNFTDDASAINDKIDDPKLGGTQYTNWEQALIMAHNLFPNRDKPDLIIFASDGNPTAYGSGSSLRYDMSGVMALPPAITAANAIKNDGIRIITLGIGDDLDINNLEAISGVGAVYTTDFDELADELLAIAIELCGGTITVYKVIDADGDLGTTDDRTSGGAGWHYELSVTGGSATPDNGDTDDAGYTVPFDISIDDDTATVTVTETVKPGFLLLDAECTDATNNGSFNGTTHSIEGIVISPFDIVSCTFYNTPGAPDFSVDTDNYKRVSDDDETDVETNTASPGETLTFTIHYHNTGNMDATGVVITDVIDSNLENITPQDGGVYAAGTITWTIGAVPVCQAGTVHFTATIKTPLADGTQIKNKASIDSDQTSPEDTNETVTTVSIVCPECYVYVDGGCVPIVIADAGDDQVISSGDSVEIGGDPTGKGEGTLTYSWGPTGGLDNTGAANPTASPTTTTTYTVTVTDFDTGCFDTDSMVVTVTTPPPPPPPPPAGGGGPAGPCYFRWDMLTEITKIRISCCGNEVLGDYVPTDPDEVHFVVIDAGTLVFCGDCPGCGDYPEIIVMSVAEDPPPPPEGMTMVGPAAYHIIGYWDRNRNQICTEVTFDPPLTLILSHDDLTEGAFSPVVAYYDEEAGCWVPLAFDAGTVAGYGKLAVLMDHLSLFAVLAELPPPPAPPPPAPTPPPPPPPPPPAHFVASDLTIVPSREKIAWGALTFVVSAGRSVTVTTNVGNDGGQEGSYVANLKINGQTWDTKGITLGPGQSQAVDFSIRGNEPGHYVVEIGGLSGEFQTSVWVNWWLIAGLTAAFILLVWVAWYYGYYRKRHLK